MRELVRFAKDKYEFINKHKDISGKISVSWDNGDKSLLLTEEDMDNILPHAMEYYKSLQGDLV